MVQSVRMIQSLLPVVGECTYICEYTYVRKTEKHEMCYIIQADNTLQGLLT